MKNNRYLISIVFIALLLAGCKDWLAITPENGLSKDQYWKTKEQVKAMVVSCYQSMMTGSSPRQGVELFFLWGEIRADMLTFSTRAATDVQNTMNGFISEELSLTNWAPVYRTINLCNTVIQLAPDVLKQDPSFTKEALNGYLSEALGIRALMYFYLVRTFGDVPLKLDATLNDEVNLSIPKSKAGDILNQIVSDLKHAEEMSVKSYLTNQDTKGRITQYAVNAMQADVYLWREQYDSCVNACDKVINSGQYGLMVNYQRLFMVGQTPESIFELEYDNQLLNPFFYMFDPGSGQQLFAAQRVVDDIYTIDENNSDNYDYRGNYASVRFSNMAVWKYIGINGGTTREPQESYAPWIFYRYADILLMKAEANVQRNQVLSSLSYIQQIRDRANALDATALLDTSSVSDYILEERAREFAYEGKRWFDLLRNAKRNKYAKKDILVTLVSEVAPEDRVAIMRNNMKDTLSHYLPINKNELRTDKALTQNEFYKTN